MKKIPENKIWEAWGEAAEHLDILAGQEEEPEQKAAYMKVAAICHKKALDN